MESLKDISPSDVATIAEFIVPGYFAISAYCAVHTKAAKDFSKVLVESVALSLPIVGVYTALWKHFVKLKPHTAIDPTAIKYFVPLLAGSLLAGYLYGALRKLPPIKTVAEALGLPGPSDDFIEVQFRKLKPDTIVTVTLKNGEIFSGVRRGISRYRVDETQLCSFSDLAWYNKKTKKWNHRPGSLVVSIGDIEYMETPYTIPK